MHFTSIYIDLGYFRKKNTPGFSSAFSMAAFPFWGEYYFIDFAFYNTALDNSFSNKKIILCSSDIKKNISLPLSRWENIKADILCPESETDFFVKLSGLIEGQYLILYDINNAALISQIGKKDIIEAAKLVDNKEIIKFSINNVPVDIYMLSCKDFINLAEKHWNNDEKEQDYLQKIIDEIMLNEFDTTIDLDGSVYFNNNIFQFYESNMNILSDKSPVISDFIAMSPDPLEKDSFITKKGMVINSIISANVKIEGFVENSIIFSDVVIKNNAKVINSVILNGNQIGKGAVITNALIFPNIKNQSHISNIQDNVVIGGNSKKAFNNNYQDQIYDGLTVIGANAFIPKNFIIEPGGYLAADIPIAKFKNNLKIARGSSFE